jgi:hypothetical protein
MPGYIESGRAPPPGALSGVQLPGTREGFTAGGGKAVGSRAGSGGPEGPGAGGGGGGGDNSKEPLAKGRGTTICVAALADLNNGDSEEEVRRQRRVC